MLDEKEMDKIVGGGEKLEKHLPPVGGLFQVPANQFWGKNTWNFFWVCTIARVLFYQCSPYRSNEICMRINVQLTDLNWEMATPQ